MAIYRFIEPNIGRLRLAEARRRMVRVVALLVVIIAATDVGLALLDNSATPLIHKLLQGLWNAVNLVTTLGDFTDFDLRQKVFMLFAMLGVVIVGGYAINQLTGMLSGDDVMAYRENRQVERTLKDLKGHSVVLGYVGLGRLVAQRLRDSSQDVVIIDRDEECSKLAAQLGYVVIQGDAGVDDNVLKSARIDTADTLFVTTQDANRNLVLTLMAHTLNSHLKIVVAAPDKRWNDMLKRAGATAVIETDEILAQEMLGRVQNSGAGRSHKA